MARKKPVANVQVTGRVVAYIQPVSSSGRIGKAKPFVVTTVKAGAAPPAPVKAPKRKRTRKK